MIFEIALLVICGFLLGYAFKGIINPNYDVLLLRESLLHIRDSLWDAAQELNCLNDPAYQLVRRILNSNVAAASTISIPLITIQLAKGINIIEIPTSQNEQLQMHLSVALNDSSDLLFIYLFKYTMVGKAILIMARFLHIVELIKDKVHGWTCSDGPDDLARLGA